MHRSAIKSIPESSLHKSSHCPQCTKSFQQSNTTHRQLAAVGSSVCPKWLRAGCRQRAREKVIALATRARLFIYEYLPTGRIR